MPQRVDVIVVGGGPAGATAAFFLGQAGKKVVVLEKEFLPRYKTCGGAISARVLEQFPFSFEPVIQSKVNAISYALGEKMVTIPVNDSSLRMVMRAEFDAYLLSHTQAEICQGTAVRTVKESLESVTVETITGERIESEYLIAADGANSIVSRALNLRRKKIMAGAIEIEASVSHETLQRFTNAPVLIFGEVGLGYLWIFPKADHLSIGIGGLRPKPGELQAVLERVMKRFGISLQAQPRTGHPLPIYRQPEALGTARCLLTGDAAGLVDPFTGEGIRFAIKSGRLAADAVLAGQPKRYTATINKQIGRNHRLGSFLTNIFYGLPKASFELALCNPTLSHGLVDMVAGRIGYGKLIASIIGAFPLFMLRKKIAMEYLK